ncbi:MAG: helix-turn-helix domain-containing protein [Chloroflexota bacterium]
MYLEHVPAHLGHFITAVWYADSAVDSNEGHVVAPSPYAEMVLKVSPSRVETVLSGVMTQQKRYPHVADAHYFGIRFAPTVGATFAGFRLRELLNESVTLERFGRTQLGSFAEQLVETAVWSEQVALLETAVQQSPFATQHFANPDVLQALDLIEQTQGQATVKQISTEVGVSRRQLERLFLKDVGASPKTFSKIIRFQHVLQLLATDDTLPLAQIALQCGFADQAHLANEFRQTIGVPISSYLGLSLP